MQGTESDNYSIQEKHYKDNTRWTSPISFPRRAKQILAKRKGSHSSQLSPIKPKVKRELLTNVPTIQGFRKLTKIRLSDNNVQNILQALEIEANAERQIDLRVKANKLYLQYTHNPLTDLSAVRPLRKQQGSILTAIEKLNKRDPSDSIKTRITPMKSQINDLCMHLKKRIQKTIRMAKNQSAQKMSAFKHPVAPSTAQILNPFEQFDNIINLKDDYFFAKYYATKQLDIFQLINQNRHRKFKSNREILGQYYFCNDSVWLPTTSSQKKVINKFYLNHLECISSFSRELARGVIPKKMPDKILLGEGDIGFDLEGLNFYDIMIVASNRLNSRALCNYFREEEEDLQKKAKDREQIQQPNAPSVIYAHNTHNQCIHFNPINRDKTEIEYFHKSPFTNIEEKQDKLSKSYHAKLKKTIQDERMILANTIRDERVLRNFEKRKERTLVEHLQGNVDKRLTLLMKEVERKIRMNKMNKNRTEKIKIESLTQSFRVKRALETATNNSKDKQKNRFSPLKTWRS